MTAYLKRDAPHAEREAISRIEATADQSIDGLPLSAFPRNVATWALLTSVTRRIELVRTERDEATQDFKSAMLNYARIATMVCGWLAERCPETSEIRLKWTDELDVASEATLATCIRYAAFWNGFPAWHGNIFAAELLDSYAVRFWSSPAEFDRRVSAYQKGIRPGGTVAEADRPSDDARNEGIVQMLERILGRAEKYGKIGVRYDLSRESIAVMTDYYDDRLLAQFRRADDIRIGVYTIRQFRRIYAVLRALCNAHQYVCDGWSHTRSATYPLDSAVLVRSRSNWISFFQKHAKLGPKPEESKQVVDAVLLDLTLADRPVDLHVHPFVALDREANSLALIPHFPLNSRPDENALRICSYRNPTAFSRASSSKEAEMTEDLIGSCPDRYSAIIRIPLAEAGDLDIAFEDEHSSTIVLCQMKWLRKPVHVRERTQQDQEIRKGVAQLRASQEFLERHPNHLRDLRVAKQPLDGYKHVHYILIARDHFIWIDPNEFYPIVEHETFKQMLREARDLKEGIEDLLTFRWLPIEGSDFHVVFDSHSVNGVTVELQGYFGGPGESAGQHPGAAPTSGAGARGMHKPS